MHLVCLVMEAYTIWHAVAQLVEALRHKRKVRGSTPDSVTRIFHWHNPSGRTMTLSSTRRTTGMSTRNTSWVLKAAGTKDWQYYHLHLGPSTSWNPHGVSRPVQGLLYLYMASWTPLTHHWQQYYSAQWKIKIVYLTENPNFDRFHTLDQLIVSSNKH